MTLNGNAQGECGRMGRIGWWKIGLQTMAARGEFTMQNLHRKIKKAGKKEKKRKWEKSRVRWLRAISINCK